MNRLPDFSGFLVIPHLRVQNANAISAPLTWGFPSMTAFVGLMWALERKTFATCGLAFQAVGVICHAFEPQVSRGGYVRTFCLSRNPVNSKGETAAIVEEGRAHMEISLIFAVDGQGINQADEENKRRAKIIEDALSTMRVAGGSILPRRTGTAPCLEFIDPDKQSEQFRKLRYASRLVPGYVLVSRQDILDSRLEELRAVNSDASKLDALLDLCRLNWMAEQEKKDGEVAKITWKQTRIKKGWIVPIPVGYAALSSIHDAGTVKNARDENTPFRFVESIYSVGEWKGAHRLRSIRELLWYAHYDEQIGLYMCRNDYHYQKL